MSTDALPAERFVYLDLADSTIRLAASFAVESAGWAQSSHPDGASVVADQLAPVRGGSPVDVLVVRPDPVRSRRAIDAFTSGEVRAVVSSTDPAALPRALDGVARGLHVVSRDVIVAALRFPTLSPRLERTLHLVVRGRGNREIARELRLSEATAKRDVGELLRHFDATNRVSLAATALRLGWPLDGRG